MISIRGRTRKTKEKTDVSLDNLPSSQVGNPLIVHYKPMVSSRKRVFRILAFVCGLFLLLTGSLIFAIESGLLDKPLSQKAQEILNASVGPRYRAEVGSTVVRFTSDFQLALKALDVNVIDRQSDQHLTTTRALDMALDPFALLHGRIAVTDIHVNGIQIDTALLPKGDPVKLEDIRIDQIPHVTEALFSQLDLFDSFIQCGNTNTIFVSGLELQLAGNSRKKPVSLVLDDFTLSKASNDSLELQGTIAINQKLALLTVNAEKSDNRIVSLKAIIENADLKPFTFKYDTDGRVHEGLDAPATVLLTAVRAGVSQEPVLQSTIELGSGQLYIDRDHQDLTSASIKLNYDFSKNALEIAPSKAVFAETSIPFNGGVIDLDQLGNASEKGFGIDLLISGGMAAPKGSGEQPLAFDIQATGQFLSGTRQLQFDKMTMSSPLGALFGSLKLQFGEESPEISFFGQSERLQTPAIKQLWPFWMAPRAREWVHANLFGGTVTNASISVFIPHGKMTQSLGKGLKLDENQLAIGFDIADARMNITGDIPPLRDAYARFDLKGPRAVVDIQTGTSFFSSGRSVQLENGRFVLPSVYEKPLMAEMKINISGAADAVGELLTYKPVQVLQRAGFEPADLNGSIKAVVGARFGLISAQNPPEPDWSAQMQLTDLDIKKPVSGRLLSKLTGSLAVDPQTVQLEAKAQIDGIPAEIDMMRPTDKESTLKAMTTISTTLNNRQREKLMPGLSTMIDGTIDVELVSRDGDDQKVSLDLKRANLTLPWIGWSKGAGIAAKAQFEISGPPDTMDVRNFQLTGDHFGAKGAFKLSKSSIVSADFDHIRLSSLDDFGVSLKRGKGITNVSIKGASADVRQLVSQLKSDKTGSADDSSPEKLSVKIDLGQIIGFNDEKITDVRAEYVSQHNQIQAVKFSGITDSRQAVVTQMDGDIINITSGDAGAVLRFIDLYRNLKNGLLNMAIRLGGRDEWRGFLDIRSFQLLNEKRLHSIVSTPSGRNRQSLNSVVKREINTSSQRFQRGFARIIAKNGIIAVENGVVRGDQIGATFQGVIRDRKSNMDMTGTFMPAYGLNRIFGELPLIGVILGNGNDRGLIGITFKLSGKFDSPKLTINPLSVIAPGVFRNIFEFQ